MPRRSPAIAAAVVAAGVLLPVPPASACPPSFAKPLRLSRDDVARGQSLRVAGEEGVTYHCPTEPPRPPESPDPSPDPTAGPSGTASPGGTPAPTARTTPLLPLPLAAAPPQAAPAPAPAPAAAPAAAPAGPREHPSRDDVLVQLQGPLTGEGFAVERVLAKVPPRGPLGKQTFDTTVTIPDDVPPGRYQLRAYQKEASGFGSAQVEVVAALPETGAPVADLVRLGLLSLLTGAGAIGAARRLR